MSQISPLFFLAYANSGGGVMKLLLAEPGAAQEFRVKGGTQDISIKLAEAVGEENVLFDKEVVKIEEVGEEEKRVRVTTKDGGVLSCKYVISAVPTSNLDRFEFSPQLSESKRALLRSMPMGNLMKVFVLYKESFWLDDGFSGEVVSTGGETKTEGCESGPITVVYDATTHNKTPALVGFIAGRNGDQWFSRTREERKAAVLAQLEVYFGPKAKDAVEYVEQNWTSDRHLSGGPVCRVAPGGMHNFRALREPHGRVYFAGTELATQWAGYMSGAAQAGLWAAARVARKMDASKLGDDDRKVLKEFEAKKVDYGKLVRSKSKNSGSYCSIL